MAIRKRTLGRRYRLIEEIGSGGMGTVYRARDTRTGDTVAVKILHPHLTRDPEYIERFRREIEISQSLTSPNIIRVLDFGTDGSDPFFVMEYVAGISLHRMLRQSGALPLLQALDIATQIATALEEAHAKGVVHRDIKPANIVIAPEGRVKVGDFGIARAQDYSNLTMIGEVVGTVQYMAPELLTAHGDARADIYSLGVVLYEMIGGEPPFNAPSPWQVIQHHRETPPPAIRGANPPAATVALIERCLEKDPERRFRSAAELSAQLKSLAATGPREARSDADTGVPASRTSRGHLLAARISRKAKSVARPVENLAKLPVWVKSLRGQWRRALFAGAALATVVALTASRSLWLGGSDTPQERTAAAVDSLSPEASTLAHVDTQNLPSSIAYPYQVNEGDTVASIAKSRSVAEDAILKANDELATPRRLVTGEAIQIPIPGALSVQSVVHVDWRDDPNDHTVPLRDFTLWGSIDTPAWSPLGDELAACGVVPSDPLHPRQIAILSRSGIDRPLALLQIECGSVNWAPDGARLVFDRPTPEGSDLYITNRVGGEPTNLTNSAEDRNHGGVWSSDGISIAFVKDRDCSVHIMNADGSPMYDLKDVRNPSPLPSIRLAPASATLGGLSWSPDAKKVAFFAATGDAASNAQCPAASPVVNALVSVDVATQQTSVIVQEANAAPGSIPRWSPNGRYIAYWSAATPSNDQGTASLVTAAVDGSGHATLTQATLADGLSWSPDSKRLAFAADLNGSHGLFTTEIDHNSRPLRLPAGSLAGRPGFASWSPRLPTPYVALRSLVGRGALLERVIYANMNGSKNAHIVVQSSLHVDSCRVGGSALPPIHFLDIFGFDPRGGQWVKVLDGTQGSSGLIPSTCLGNVNTVDVQVARPDGGGDVLAITVASGANRQSYDFLVVGMARDVPSVLYERRNELGFAARAEGDRITIRRAYFGKHDALCCPSADAAQVLTITGDHQVIEDEPAFTPSCLEGSVDYPYAITDGSAISVSCVGSIDSESRASYTIDLTTTIQNEQGGVVPGVTDQRQIPTGSKVRVDSYRVEDKVGLVAEHVTVTELPAGWASSVRILGVEPLVGSVYSPFTPRRGPCDPTTTNCVTVTVTYEAGAPSNVLGGWAITCTANDCDQHGLIGGVDVTPGSRGTVGLTLDKGSGEGVICQVFVEVGNLGATEASDKTAVSPADSCTRLSR